MLKLLCALFGHKWYNNILISFLSLDSLYGRKTYICTRCPAVKIIMVGDDEKK